MNTQELKQIIADAPKECTHSRPESEYGYDNLGFKLNALSDIKTIVEQYERIAELEQQKQVLIEQHDMWRQQWSELTQSLDIRDLEQQARGIEDFIKLFSFYYSEQDADFIYSEDATSYCARLRKQAAKLKEQG